MCLKGERFSFQFLEYVYIFQLFVYNFSNKTSTFQTHSGFINIRSKMHRSLVTAFYLCNSSDGTHCTLCLFSSTCLIFLTWIKNSTMEWLDLEHCMWYHVAVNQKVKQDSWISKIEWNVNNSKTQTSNKMPLNFLFLSEVFFAKRLMEWW